MRKPKSWERNLGYRDRLVWKNGIGNCGSILKIFSPYNTSIKRSVNRLNQINAGNGRHCCLQELFNYLPERYIVDEMKTGRQQNAALGNSVHFWWITSQVSSIKLFTNTHLMAVLSESLAWECGIWPAEMLSTCSCWWTLWELGFACRKCYIIPGVPETNMGLCVLNWTLKIRKQFHRAIVPSQ